jgi:hypothetical protein
MRPNGLIDDSLDVDPDAILPFLRGFKEEGTECPLLAHQTFPYFVPTSPAPPDTSPIDPFCFV